MTIRGNKKRLPTPSYTQRKCHALKFIHQRIISEEGSTNLPVLSPLYFLAPTPTAGAKKSSGRETWLRFSRTHPSEPNSSRGRIPLAHALHSRIVLSPGASPLSVVVEIRLLCASNSFLMTFPHPPSWSSLLYPLSPSSPPSRLSQFGHAKLGKSTFKGDFSALEGKMMIN